MRQPKQIKSNQIREKLENADSIVGTLPGGCVLVKERLKVYAENDSCAGYVLVINGKGHEFVRYATTSDIENSSPPSIIKKQTALLDSTAEESSFEVFRLKKQLADAKRIIQAVDGSRQSVGWEKAAEQWLQDIDTPITLKELRRSLGF